MLEVVWYTNRTVPIGRHKVKDVDETAEYIRDEVLFDLDVNDRIEVLSLEDEEE